MIKFTYSLIFIFSLCISQAYAEYFVVSNSSNKNDSIEKSILKRLYLGTVTELTGERVKLALLAIDKNTLEDFYNDVINLDQKNYNRYWRKKLFSGAGIPPKKFKRIEELLDFVARNQNAIGIIDKKVKQKNIKILSVK